MDIYIYIYIYHHHPIDFVVNPGIPQVLITRIQVILAHKTGLAKILQMIILLNCFCNVRQTFFDFVDVVRLSNCFAEVLALGCTGTNRCIDPFQRSFPEWSKNSHAGIPALSIFVGFVNVTLPLPCAPAEKDTRHETPKESQSAVA